MTAIRFERESPGSFYRVAKRRVDEHFLHSGKSRFADRSIFVKAVALLGVILGSYALVLLQICPNWMMLPLAFAFGLASLLFVINVGHEAAHRTLFQSKFWNDAVLALAFAPIGMSGYLWKMRHIHSHHLFPNLNGCDSDIDENPFLRLSPNHPWRPHFRFQHLYAPLVYLILGLHSLLWQEFGYLFKKQLANMTDIRHPPHQYLLFAMIKSFHFAAVLVVPMVVLPFPWWQVLLGYMAMTGVVSLAFVALLAPSHYSDVVEFPVVASDGAIGHPWSIHNLVTTCDWSPHNRMALSISGGFNTHASHHLFPKVSHAHYSAIARIVEETAVECGVRYNRKSMTGVLLSHFRFLRNMGRKPEPTTTYKPA